MNILNEQLDWSTFNADVHEAFRFPPKKVLLDPQTLLCRFIAVDSAGGDRRGRIFNSPWWLNWTSALAELAHWAHVAPREVIRARLAITSQFNPEIDSLAQIILDRPVFAWQGKAKYQNDEGRRVTFIGGGEQFFLPNLASDTSGLHSPYADLHCFTSIDSLHFT